jgi:putative heme-binding domain-containing protein
MTYSLLNKKQIKRFASFALFCLFFLFSYQSADAQRHLRDIPEPDIGDELASFTVADGFEISLFASTPMLGKPTQINFDRDGRLWVASSQIYPQLKANQEASDGIIVLEDNDGDGVADTSSVFYDELIIPGGVLPDGRGGAYVAHGENLIHLHDDDKDGRADRKNIVLSGFGSEDTHHTLHRLHWGPDGLLYMFQGYYIGTHVETLYGPRRLNGGGLWSYDTESRRLEIFSRGLTNPWGSAFDRWGQNFQTDGAGGGGVVYSFPEAVFYNSPLEKRALKGLNPNRPKSSGISILSGEHFPEEWRGSIVTSDFRANNMDRYTVEIDQSTYKSVVEDDLVSSTRVTFRPIDTVMGPDGALYLADWYNPIIQHGEVDFRDNRRDQVHGRIWRITAKNRALLKAPDYAGSSIVELLELLKAEEDWVRLNAKQALKDRDRQEVVTVMDEWVRQLDRSDADYDHYRLEALWTLQTLKVVNSDLLRDVLQSNVPEARAAAIRILSHWRKDIPMALELLEAAIADSSHQVRREAVTALGQFEDSEAVEIAARALDLPMDLNLDFALWRTCRKLEPYWLPEFTQGTVDFNGDSDHLIFALEAIENRQVLTTLIDIVESKGTEAPPSIIRVIGRLGSPKELELLVDIASKKNHPLVESAMLGLLDAASERNIVPDKGRSKLLRNGVKSSNPNVVAAACRLAGLWGETAMAPQLQELLSTRTSSEDVRRAAGEGLTHLDSQGVRTFLRSLVQSDDAIETRLIAAETLIALEQEAGADAVAGLLTEVSNKEQIEELIRPVLIKQGAVEALAAALQGKTLSKFVVTQVSLMLEVSGRESSALLAALRGSIDSDSTIHDDPRGGRMAELLTRLAEGDIARGKVVYESPQIACIDCHAIAGNGGTLGPALDSIGASAPMDYIIQSIIEPSEKIKEGYRAVDIFTKDGDFYSGAIQREDEYSIYLRASATEDTRVLKSTIDTLETSPLSMMPSELTVSLTDTEFLDLLAYLKSLGKE